MVREAVIADAPEVIRLLTLLGHEQPAADASARLAAFFEAGDRVLVSSKGAAAPGAPLTGAVTLHITPELHRPGPIGRMTAVAVDEAVRGNGVGGALVAAAEKYFIEHGCAMVEVTSNKKRTRAHSFYEQLGYTGTSFRFAKTLEAK